MRPDGADGSARVDLVDSVSPSTRRSNWLAFKLAEGKDSQMSDPVRSQRDRTSPPLPASPTTSFLRRLAGQLLDTKQAAEPEAGDAEAEITQRRIDRAHAPAPPRSSADPGRTPATSPGLAPTEPPHVSQGASQSPPFSRREEEVLRQTGQIAAHLRTEREELERRESAL